MLLDPRSGGQIRAHLHADPVVVRGRTRYGIVLSLGDRPVDHLPTFQNRDRQAHHEHEQRNPEGRTLPIQTYCPLHGSITPDVQPSKGLTIPCRNRTYFERALQAGGRRFEFVNAHICHYKIYS